MILKNGEETIIFMKKNKQIQKTKECKKHKNIGEQYLNYLLDHPQWRCHAEAESFALLMFIDDI